MVTVEGSHGYPERHCNSVFRPIVSCKPGVKSTMQLHSLIPRKLDLQRAKCRESRLDR